MPEAQSTITVDVPLSTAYNQWTQFETFPSFMNGVDSVKQLSDTSLHWVASPGGVEREWDAEITAQEPDSHIAWQSVGEVKQSGRVEFAAAGLDSTEVTLTLDWEPEGFVEKAGAAFQVDDAYVRRDLSAFKEFIESRGGATGAWRGEV
ncbi:SRPBCC family protein [Demequina sp. TTPB684]|uniref:SRPBCC family protein n=1 Tax=unclassified Demequina TaxID=2620311 RepID=UPI001CF5F990|nr:MULTISPECIES: SRPBCC family protein [unclassified Demequina]MCB2411746.1 SRPBCC family protein [Demequina sp. TTPB684]UPU87308.1 SRPBCC family protein [Demequina sp. TMPB413]